MKAKWWRAALAALVVGQSAAAMAEPRIVEQAARFAVIPAAPASQRIFHKNEIMMTFPAVWSDAVVLGASAPAGFRDGEVLARTGVAFDEAGLSRATVYCTPRLATVSHGRTARAMFGVLGSALYKSSTDGQRCLIDADKDGRFDHRVSINEGTPPERTPSAITPLAYAAKVDLPSGAGDKLEFKYIRSNIMGLSLLIDGNYVLADPLALGREDGTVIAVQQDVRKPGPDGRTRYFDDFYPIVIHDVDKSAATAVFDLPALAAPLRLMLPDRYGNR